MSETGTDGAQMPEEQRSSGKLSRRRVLGGMAAVLGRQSPSQRNARRRVARLDSPAA